MKGQQRAAVALAVEHQKEHQEPAPRARAMMVVTTTEVIMDQEVAAERLPSAVLVVLVVMVALVLLRLLLVLLSLMLVAVDEERDPTVLLALVDLAAVVTEAIIVPEAMELQIQVVAAVVVVDLLVEDRLPLVAMVGQVLW